MVKNGLTMSNRVAEDSPRNCKVITTCFIGREVREETRIAGDPPGMFNHCQSFSHPEKVLELVEHIYDLECSIDPGVKMDTVIVNNDTGWEKGNKYLRTIDGAPTFSGRIRVVHRENYGRSFGGYNRAFELFGRQYECWMFTEDDILVIGDGYFRHCIETFNENRSARAGFVAIQGISREHRRHAHGGVGMTHVDVLKAVYEKYGKLPHCGKNEPQEISEIIARGEIAFTNSIEQLGYRIVEVESPVSLYAFAYDHMRKTPSEKRLDAGTPSGSNPEKRRVAAEELAGRSPRERFELLQIDRDVSVFFPRSYGQAIWDAVSRHRPDVMMEFGVYRGYSTIVAALAMEEIGHGHLIANDCWEEGKKCGFDESALALDNINKYHIGHRVSLRETDFWNWLRAPEPCDLVYLDIHNDGNKIKAAFDGLKSQIEKGLEVYFEGGSPVKDLDDAQNGRTPIGNVRNVVGYEILSEEPPSLSRISLDPGAELRNLRASLESEITRRTCLEEEVRLLRTSTCWRMTAPLRAVLDFLRGLGRRG